MRVDQREDAPVVTVVLPAYNPGAYLLSSLASLRSQSDRRWRAIVVDDGSDDDLSWVAEYDPRVILLCQENAGVGAARNAGLRQADSEFVAFLDQDDMWYPRKMAVQIDAMLAHPEAGLSSTDFEIIKAFFSCKLTYKKYNS